MTEKDKWSDLIQCFLGLPKQQQFWRENSLLCLHKISWNTNTRRTSQISTKIQECACTSTSTYWEWHTFIKENRNMYKKVVWTNASSYFIITIIASTFFQILVLKIEKQLQIMFSCTSLWWILLHGLKIWTLLLVIRQLIHQKLTKLTSKLTPWSGSLLKGLCLLRWPINYLLLLNLNKHYACHLN